MTAAKSTPETPTLLVCNCQKTMRMEAQSFGQVLGENKEQIEVSKYYEKLPKPHALAVQEWLDDKIYYRDTTKD